ncbi:MAG: tetratricopeptide repeat protein [Crocinitomicaceae bacterium]|nr:tetratricopeptide repeat protein [Crocinitomicaceae bacterium]
MLIQRCCSILFLMLYACFMHASDALEKSKLLQNLSSSKTEEQRLAAVVALSELFLVEHQLDSAAKYLNKASLIADRLVGSDITSIGLTFEQAESLGSYYSAKGYYHFYLFERFAAIDNFEKALVYFTKIQDNKNLADCMNNLAVLSKDIGDLDNAILYNLRALDLYENLNDINGRLNVMFTLSVVYREQENLDISLAMSHEILAIYRKNNDKHGEAKVLNLLAGIQKDLGDTTAAMINYANSLAIYKDLKNLQGQAKVMNNIGVLHKHWKEWDSALEYFNAALEITIKQNQKVGQAFALENMAIVYFSKGDIENALATLDKANDIASDIGFSDLNQRIAHLYFTIYESLEDWALALKWHKKYTSIKEHVTLNQLKSKSELENQKYEFEKNRLLANKDAEKRLAVYLEKENRQRIILIIAIMLLLILAGFSLYISKKLKQLKVKSRIIFEQSEERKLLLKEIHHRVKNNFQIVGSLLRLQSYKLQSDEAIQSFEESINRINAMSLVHDIIYKQDRFDRIQAMEYLQKLTEQLKKYAPQKNLKIDIDTRETFLEVDTLIYLGIILNELIINSIKYGFTDEITDPIIAIELWEDSDCFILTYKENGVGIDKEKYEESFGMELINTVAEQLNGKVEIMNNKLWRTIFKFRFMKEDEAH